MKARAALGILFAACLSVRPAPGRACGPFFPEVVFTPPDVTTVPLDRYLNGELGILQPGYGLRLLWPAYRALAGKPLTAGEARAVREALDPAADPAAAEPSALATWLAERAKVPGAGPGPLEESMRWLLAGIDREAGKPGEWLPYLNCPQDTFRQAVETLRGRSARFGPASPEVLAWVRAQDTVYANCREGRAIPDPAPPGADPLVRADRAYQIAAAHFYAGEHDAAERLFREIAADPASPWRDVSAYLVGRTLFRKASRLGEFGARPDTDLLRAAEREFAALLADPARAAVHGPAAAHLRRVRAKLEPFAYLGGIAAALSAPSEDPDVRERLAEYRFLLRESRWMGDPAIGDLTAWLLEVRSLRIVEGMNRERARANVFGRAFSAWERTRSLPWLLAALMAADSGRLETWVLVEKAAQLPADSPAYLTAAYHRLRLLADVGKADEARALADRLLADPRLTAADRNLVLGERVKTARTLEEFLHDAQRRPVGMDDGEGHTEIGPPRHLSGGRLRALFDGRALLDPAAAAVMEERLPLAALARAAESPALPAHLRRDVAVALFVRSVIIGDHERARAAAPALRTLAPELAGGIKRYLAAKDPDEATFAAGHLILGAPGMQPRIAAGGGRREPILRIDNFRDNWWGDLKLRPGGGTGAPPAFLSAEEQAEAARQREALSKIPAAPEHLGGIVLAWARSHPKDARVPEALHLVVRAGRYGMSPPRSPTSREAFELLHRRYPASDWTARTPHWY